MSLAAIGLLFGGLLVFAALLSRALPTNEELARALAGPYEPNPIHPDAPTGEHEIAHETMVEVLADYWCVPEDELAPVGKAWREGYCEYCGKGTGAWACTHFEDHLKHRMRAVMRDHGEAFCASCGEHIEGTTWVEEVLDSPVLEPGETPTFEEPETERWETWEPCLCRFDEHEAPQLFHFPVHPETHPEDRPTPEERLAKVGEDPLDSWETTRYDEVAP